MCCRYFGTICNHDIDHDTDMYPYLSIVYLQNSPYIDYFHMVLQWFVLLSFYQQLVDVTKPLQNKTLYISFWKFCGLELFQPFWNLSNKHNKKNNVTAAIFMPVQSSRLVLNLLPYIHVQPMSVAGPGVSSKALDKAGYSAPSLLTATQTCHQRRLCSNTLDCFTVWTWWHMGGLRGMRHVLQVAGFTLFVIGWSEYRLGLPMSQWWLVEISTIFQKPLTVPLHSPNDRPAVLCKETVKESTNTPSPVGQPGWTELMSTAR